MKNHRLPPIKGATPASDSGGLLTHQPRSLFASFTTKPAHTFHQASDLVELELEDEQAKPNGGSAPAAAASSSPPGANAALGSIDEAASGTFVAVDSGVGSSGTRRKEAPAMASPPPSDPAVAFTVRFMVGDAVTINAPVSFSLRFVKLRIDDQRSIRPSDQTLVLNGRVLDNDNKTLAEYGVTAGTVLWCLDVSQAQKMRDPPPVAPTVSHAFHVDCPLCGVLIVLAPGMEEFLCPRCRTHCRAPPQFVHVPLTPKLELGALSAFTGANGRGDPPPPSYDAAAGEAKTAASAPAGGASPSLELTSLKAPPVVGSAPQGSGGVVAGDGAAGVVPAIFNSPVLNNAASDHTLIQPISARTRTQWAAGNGVVPITAADEDLLARARREQLALIQARQHEHDQQVSDANASGDVQQRLRRIVWPNGDWVQAVRSFWIMQCPLINLWWLAEMMHLHYCWPRARLLSEMAWFDTAASNIGLMLGGVVAVSWQAAFVASVAVGRLGFNLVPLLVAWLCVAFVPLLLLPVFWDLRYVCTCRCCAHSDPSYAHRSPYECDCTYMCECCSGGHSRRHHGGYGGRRRRRGGCCDGDCDCYCDGFCCAGGGGGGGGAGAGAANGGGGSGGCCDCRCCDKLCDCGRCFNCDCGQCCHGCGSDLCHDCDIGKCCNCGDCADCGKCACDLCGKCACDLCSHCGNCVGVCSGCDCHGCDC